MTSGDGIGPGAGREMAALATSIAEAPGVYALLLGSGISQGAGVQTGWGVAMTLIAKLAAAEGVELASEDDDLVRGWWEERTGEEVTYSGILDEVASTHGQRQQILRPFFERRADGGRALPSRAHERIAQLVADGHIRVILTTNFDRLMEDALAAKGINPQVIRTSEDVGGMIPLIHAPVTVVKLHGDFMSLDMRNSEIELSGYPEPLGGLLDRILDEFGLVIMGWSSRWDPALRQALRARVNHRYPCWWATPEPLGTEARQVEAVTGLRTILIRDADSWAADLTDRIGLVSQIHRPRPRFARLADPPEIEREATASGWAVSPRLQLELACAWVPIDGDALIRAEERETMLAVLARAPITETMRSLVDRMGTRPPHMGESERARATEAATDGWVEPDGAHQSSALMAYRWGTDGSHGASALASVAGLEYGSGNRWTARARLGLSLAGPLSLRDLALLVAGGLDLTLQVIRALSDTVGQRGDDLALSCALGASHQLYPGANLLRRDPDGALAELIDFDPFGPPPARGVRNAMAFGSSAAFDITESETADLVASGMEHMAYARGWTDPRAGIAAIRRGLEATAPGSVPPATSTT